MKQKDQILRCTLALLLALPLTAGCDASTTDPGVGSAGGGSGSVQTSPAGAGSSLGGSSSSSSAGSATGGTPAAQSGGAGAPSGGATGASVAGAGSGGSNTSSAGMGAVGGAGSGGATAVGGASTGSCLPSYLLCEDFEDTAPGMVPTDWTAHGMASVADDEAHGGQHALKVSPADNGQRRIVHDASMLGAQHWGRVYYKVQLPVPDAFVHSTLVAMTGTGPTVGDAEFRFVDTVKDQKTGGFAMGNHQFLFNVQPNGPEFGKGTSYDYTFDGEWHCVEWHVDAADQSYHFYYEGEDVLNFTNGAGNFTESELPDGFSEVRLGWNNYQSAPPGFTAWLDDFALAETRIDCLP